MARKEKVTESTSTLESPREAPEFESAQSPAGDAEIELVAEPGPVKRIVFEGAPQPPAPAAPSPAATPEAPREFRRAVASEGAPSAAPLRSPAVREHTESIYSIHEEVDHLRSPDPSFAGAPPRANLRSWRSSVVYRTDQGGEVRAYEGPTGKTITLADGGRERRFTEEDVDRVIANVRLDGESAPPAGAASEATETVQEEPRKKRGFFSFARKKKAAEPEPAPAAPESDYQPQCSAITEEGLQCRNSARGGSKYCSSHYGFQPRTAQGIHQARDTEPRYDSSRDTTPGAWDPSVQGSAQCVAVTRDGKQCQNPVMAGSPHCGSHQGYEEPSHHDVVKSVDTKPRWSKAKDTKPSTRKSKASRPTRRKK